MTDEQIELARRLVARERKEWDGLDRAALFGAYRQPNGILWMELADGEWLLDLTDPATAGVLLEMLPAIAPPAVADRKIGDAWQTVEAENEGDRWCVTVNTHRLERFTGHPYAEITGVLADGEGATLGEAVARTLLAIPEVNSG